MPNSLILSHLQQLISLSTHSFSTGNNTELTKFARANGEPLREIYCWAHGTYKSAFLHCQ